MVSAPSKAAVIAGLSGPIALKVFCISKPNFERPAALVVKLSV